MSAARSWIVVVALCAGGLAWGWSFDMATVPARPTDLTTPVDAGWYDRLPMDPGLATHAYLERVPASMRARGDSYSDSRLVAFELRVATLVLATLFLCISGLAAAMRSSANRSFTNPIAANFIVAVQYFLAMFALALPTEVYASFMRPHWAGFSSQSFGGWLADHAIGEGVFIAFYLVGVLLLYGLIKRHARGWALGAIGVYAVLRTVYALLTPNFIEPLTNSYSPLRDGQQKQEILALARANGISHPDVVVGNASAQTRMLNAHVSGIGSTARISVDDNTLERTSDAMLRAVVAHEIGHYVLDHTAMAVVTDTLLMAIGFLLIAVATSAVVRRFGARWGMEGVGDIATLPVLWGFYLLWGFVSLPASNAISRVYEHQADLFSLNAAREPHGLAEFMIHDADIARLEPTTLEYALFYDHPSDAQRVHSSMVWRAGIAQLQHPPGP